MAGGNRVSKIARNGEDEKGEMNGTIPKASYFYFHLGRSTAVNPLRKPTPGFKH
jgi:hypothetical protein